MDDRVSKAVARAQQEAEATHQEAKTKRPASGGDKLVPPTPRALERMWKRILNK